MLTEMTMPTKLKIFAIAAALAAGTSSAAMAQYTCPAGYALYGGVCQPVTAPVPAPGYSNPVSGAVSGEQAGAASGYATGGPVGAIVGGALGTAVTGTANTLAGAAPAPVCAPGYVLYSGYCYPR
jgi:hypothetical protein